MCSGNTCRSPLAEGIAKKIFPNSLSDQIEISSAGSSALEGLPASALAIRVAENNGIDLTGHITRLLNRSLVKEADLIVVMSSKHKETIRVIEPSALEYTFLLSEFCDGIDGDIADPIGGNFEGYERTFELINNCLSQMKDRLKTFDGWAK